MSGTVVIRQDASPCMCRVGRKRKLSILTVIDQIIQQAFAQVLTPIYEKEFSEFSYGFRFKRRVIQALRQGGEYVSEGRNVVVDMDLKSFFDEVNRDRLMYRFLYKNGVEK